jgi:probable O-glycosylation ligase (exosortase A-associated)
MRDLLILCLLPVMLYTMAQRPFIAVGMWLWTALFFPNGWLYGFASIVRFNLLFTGVAMLSYLAYKHKPNVRLGAIGGLVLVFFLWTTLSTITTIGNPNITWEYWTRFLKVVMLFVFVLLTVKDKLHVDFVLWCVVLSVGFYADLEALKFVASGGGHKIAGMAGHVLGDRNELSVAFVMTLPLCYYLLGEYGHRSKLLRLALLGTMAALAVAVIGTQSRGGFIALLALVGYMYIKSDRKILMTILIASIAFGLSYIVSDDWSSRIDTISTAENDDSFMGRVVAWKLSFILAMQHPFFGGGFKSLEYFPNWAALSQDFFSYPWFYTGTALPNPTVARAAHSVYFQLMGEHGFVGMGLYVCALAGSFFKAGKVARVARRAGAPAWIPTAATMIQLSIFAFALGGAALSFAYFDLIFALFALVVVFDLRILPAALHLTQRSSASMSPPVFQPRPQTVLP